jgi:hypothetical protein
MTILSPSVNVFEYEFIDLNASSNIQRVFGIPSKPYALIPPVHKDTTLEKIKPIPEVRNCNNVHYEICKEGTLDIGLVFEYDSSKSKIRPFTNFRNMLYYASFDPTIDLCFISKIRKFYNGSVIGEYTPLYEDINDKLRIQELHYRAFETNVVVSKWTFEYIQDADKETIIVNEFSSVSGVTYALVRKIISVNNDVKDKVYDVHMQQTYYNSSNDIIDYQKLVYVYQDKTRYLSGFDKENYQYMRLSVDTHGRAHVISKVLEWNTIVSCNVFYFAEFPFIIPVSNLNQSILCEQYYGVSKEYSRRIEIDVDEKRHYINSFTDFEDYGLINLAFETNHKYITEIRYYNEIGFLVKKAHPVYTPDYKIDSLIFSVITDDDTELVYGGVLNFYYDINRKLYKVMKFNSDELLEKHYTVDRLTSGRIDRFVDHLKGGFNIDLKYKTVSKMFDGANRYIALNKPSVKWTHGCYDHGIPNALFFEDNLTIETKFFSTTHCSNVISGTSDVDEPIATELIYKDEYNSIDFVYDYDAPKVHRFFTFNGDWNFADGAGCQPYLKYLIVKDNGNDYFVIPYYADNGKPYYVDIYNKISDVKVGTFLKRIEYLDTLGKESFAYEMPNDVYELKYAKPYVTRTGYFNSENTYATTIARADDGYHELGYFVSDNYLEQALNAYQSPMREPCPEDECNSAYWEDDCTIDTLYVIMCAPVVTGCQDFYFENLYMEKYIDMCLPGCTDLYVDIDYLPKDARFVDSCLLDTGCTDLYVDIEYAIEQDVYILCPGA